MRLQSRTLVIFGCILLLVLHLQTAIAATSSESSESFDVTVQPVYHFIEPGTTYEYMDIIHISSQNALQTLSVTWTSTSPFINIIYENSIEIDQTGNVDAGYSLETDIDIPSGDYELEYEISNQVGIAYGGIIPVRVYRQTDPDVVDIEIQALSPFEDVRYSKVDISVEYNGNWRVLTPSVNYNHSLRLITGNYRLTITDIITDVQLNDYKTITAADNNAQFQYTIPLIHFNLIKLSYDEINFTVTNYMGVQNTQLVLRDGNGNILAEYQFVVTNGVNQLSFPMPEVPTNELQLELSVNSYSQIIQIEISNQARQSNDIPIEIIALAPLLLVGIVKFVRPRLHFRRTPAEVSIENSSTD